MLAKSSPRVKVHTIGTSEGAYPASEALLARLDENIADLGKLADPRTLKMDDAAADVIAKRAAPVYYITGAIHSTKGGAPTALMELAYRLAVDDSAYVRNANGDACTPPAETIRLRRLTTTPRHDAHDVFLDALDMSKSW